MDTSADMEKENSTMIKQEEEEDGSGSLMMIKQEEDEIPEPKINQEEVESPEQKTKQEDHDDSPVKNEIGEGVEVQSKLKKEDPEEEEKPSERRTFHSHYGRASNLPVPSSSSSSSVADEDPEDDDDEESEKGRRIARNKRERTNLPPFETKRQSEWRLADRCPLEVKAPPSELRKHPYVEPRVRMSPEPTVPKGKTPPPRKKRKVTLKERVPEEGGGDEDEEEHNEAGPASEELTISAQRNITSHRQRRRGRDEHSIEEDVAVKRKPAKRSKPEPAIKKAKHEKHEQDNKIKIHLSCLTGYKITITISPDASIAELKRAIEDHEQVPTYHQRAIWKGLQLGRTSTERDDEREIMTLREYGVEDGDSMSLVQKLKGS